MYIKEITYQYRRDFKAIYKCEFCETEVISVGYDDEFFHEHVIPTMKCIDCDKASGVPYNKRETKYPEGYQI